MVEEKQKFALRIWNVTKLRFMQARKHSLIWMLIAAVSYLLLNQFWQSSLPVSAELPKVEREWVQISEVPRIYVMEDFITSQEADLIIQECGKNPIISGQRPSWTSWCKKHENVHPAIQS